MASHELIARPDTVHWGFLDAGLKPVLKIEDGDTVIVHTLSGACEEVPADKSQIRPELLAIHETLVPFAGPHILLGPIYIRGARPGDMLKIDILDIDLRDDWGFNTMRPGKGALPNEFNTHSVQHFEIDRVAKTIKAPWGSQIAARPFFGIIATAPNAADGKISSILPGYYGGNLDIKDLVAESSLYLPVSVEGGLVSVGDGHASQGDGEVCLTAVETALIGRLRISVIREMADTFPYGETASHLIAIALDQDLDEAIRQALRRAIDMICLRTELTRAQAYTLCSIAADVRISQLVNIRKGVHVMVPKEVLPI